VGEGCFSGGGSDNAFSGNEAACVISELSGVVHDGVANGVFFNSPMG
jgi:hypothetical protein